MTTTKRDDEEMSMEDILASIRRYVADEAPAEQADRQQSHHQEAAFQERKPYQQPSESSPFDASMAEVIHLTERNEPSAPSFAPPPPEQTVRPDPRFTAETLISEKVQTVSSQAFSRLAEAARPQTPPSFKATSTSAAGGGLTLDHLISELARPMIKQWLDNNLPGIVESLVNKEIERITRLNDSR